MKIQVFEQDDIHADALALLEEAGHQLVYGDLQTRELASIEAIFIRTYTQVDATLLHSYPSLKYVIKAGAGLDNIDIDECKKLQINVYNSPGANAHSVAELAIGFAIYLLRNVTAQAGSLKNGGWRDRQYLGHQLTRKTIGILGCGAVGKLIAKKMQGFELNNILGYDPYLSQKQLADANITKANLAEILHQADVVILCIPLTNETRNLIKSEQLAMMKATSYIINVSRGGIVSEQDLFEALNTDVIAGAAVDVFENEPGGIKKELLESKKLLATPHIGGFTHEADRAICISAVENFLNSVGNE